MRLPSAVDKTPALIIGYSGLLAAVAGFVNAVAILILAFPVGNLTASTTKLGMNAANPLLYHSCVLALIIIGFLGGATAAGAVLAAARSHSGPRHAIVLVCEAVLLVMAIVIPEHTVATLLAAGACGLQNGATSSLRGMAVRTTHFTGTITDLGLLLGRSRHHGIDRAKAVVLTTTIASFLLGSAIGTVLGARIGDAAFLVPAAICVTVALVGLTFHRRQAPPTSDRRRVVAAAEANTA